MHHERWEGDNAGRRIKKEKEKKQINVPGDLAGN